MLIDLHTHTTISDGVYSPEELIKKGIAHGLSVLCITDHNAINPDLPGLREKYPQIELPSGCEFSCNYTTIEGRVIQLHIGGIGFDQDHEAILRVIRHNQSSMRGYIEMILYKLKANCHIRLCTYEELLSRNPLSQSVGRKHIAAEMVRQGICKNIDEAFDVYLSNRDGIERPAYVSNALNFSTIEEVVHAVLSAGGIASMCHLFEYLNNYQLSAEEESAMLSYYKQLTGCRGAIEVYYSSYTGMQRYYLKKTAKKYDLLWSAASDYHGDGKVRQLGAYPYEVYERMLEAMKKESFE